MLYKLTINCPTITLTNLKIFQNRVYKMDNRNKTRGQSRTAIYRRNIKKLKRFLTAFSPSGPIFPSPDYLEQQVN